MKPRRLATNYSVAGSALGEWALDGRLPQVPGSDRDRGPWGWAAARIARITAACATMGWTK